MFKPTNDASIFLAEYDHIFVSSTGVIGFEIVAFEMAALYESLLNMKGSAASVVDRLTTIADQVRGNKSSEDDTLSYLEDLRIPAALHVRDEMTAMAEYALTFAFIERALRTIINDRGVSKHEYETLMKSQRHNANIDKQILILQQKCRLRFEVPDSFSVLIKGNRKVRNKIAHGDWDTVFSEQSKDFMEDAMVAITELLESIEHAYKQSRIR